jgi:hypothetical protein
MPDREGALVPVYAFLAGDTLGLVVLVREHDTVETLGHRLRQAAGVRVASAGAFDVIHAGRTLDPKRTIADAGITPLDRVDVVARAGA